MAQHRIRPTETEPDTHVAAANRRLVLFRIAWVAALSIVVALLFSQFLQAGARSEAADVPPNETPAATGQPSTAPGSDQAATTTTNSNPAAARAAERKVWGGLKPAERRNLCKAYNKYPTAAIRGAFLQMAAADQASFASIGADPREVWRALQHRLAATC